jgi:Holliday junction resolvase RusA-like endonuclease
MQDETRFRYSGGIAMPLSQGTSKEVLQANIKTEIAAGKSPEQAAAIAYATRRRNQDADIKRMCDALNAQIESALKNKR